MIAPTGLDTIAARMRPHATRSDAELIAACLDGRQRAWDELIERYQRLVYSVPRKCRLGDADAEDVVQAVFIQLYRRLESLRDAERLASWLLTTAYRESWRIAREGRRHVGDGDLVDMPGPVPDDATVADAERTQLVRQALRALGGRCEALLTALFRENGVPNYEAIARELDMKVGSIGPTRARCFRKLERILLDLGFDAEVLESDVPQPSGSLR